ncbi:hypothetical protein SPBR_05154 [Sporothrix brasiliensis 5110]|uniref:RmlD-like substrate binding domain-containing protein n=1 Tax=Sporothrix brasiliensis 5110 TaxID=1398154 RepID=A0A0C2ISG4_9PEZI|nr:uncharacterized protein SPBR_05154 [Sporothrix brasiliensis 5110]KIH87942.1 hypothetical protein SPBR_05154 [Sporothrix brasiliensis 5110]
MSDKHVLVTGASGLLGRQVVRAFGDDGWTVTGTAFSRANGTTLRKVDLEDASAVEAVLESVAPSVVVHCAANRFPDKVDKDPQGTKRLNIDASKSLASLCAARNIVLIYISTDYVFPGTKGEAPYEADTTPSPPNLYGESKLDGEKAVLGVYSESKDTTGRAVVLRVPVLYGQAEKPSESAVNTLLDTVNKVQAPDASAKMDNWSVRYPTNTEDVARVLKDVAKKYRSADPSTTLPPVLQFSSEDRYTKYEICQVLAEVLGVGLDRLEADPTGGNVPGGVQRPYDCHLSTKALQDLGIPVHTQNFKDWWRRELKAFRH